ncbi:hypothetical protein, partial [Streptomyces hydrogenans]|uniref:hypothetical protein n=1 Tax=Streptomyces hydrogenans TaxID=1873719 RepID=UPI0035DD9286
MVRSLEDIQARVRELETRYADHDRRKNLVHQVRSGELEKAFPDLFRGSMRLEAAANFIDVAARDFSEMVAPLPSLNTASGSQTSEKARKFQERRKFIGANYWEGSNLRIQMPTAADNYQTAGVAYAIVEPCFKSCMPKIRIIDSMGCYPEFDLERNCVGFARKLKVRAQVLAEKYPHYRDRILKSRSWQNDQGDRLITVIKWVDADQHGLWMEEDRIPLDYYPNKLGECPVVPIVRPPGEALRGAYDDLCGVQAARAFMLRLALQNAEQQVNAPLAVPNDTTDVPLGPLSLLHTDQPQNVRRVDLAIPGSTFAEIQTLQQELLTGARTPQQRFGSQPGSIVTGKGVEALLGGYDAQVKQAQVQFGWALENITRLCFKMDYLYWPDREKSADGTLDGAPYSIRYTPRVDIDEDYTCDISYGFVAGLDPNRAVVFMLQLLAAGVIPRELVMRSMPFDLDVTRMQQQVEAEKLNDAAMNGLAAMVQAIGPLAQQGEDPSLVLG